MKRFFAFLLCIMLLFLFGIRSLAEENNSNITGLEEKLASLFLDNHFTQEQIAEMDRHYIDNFNKNWGGILRGLKATGKMKTKSDEEEYQYILNEMQLDYHSGILVSLLATTGDYTQQYASENRLEYLFVPQRYWFTPRYSTTGSGGRFTEDGVLFTNMSDIGTRSTLISISFEAINFLRNTNQIEQMLREKGEDSVIDIKLFVLDSPLSFLYLRCAEQEYLCKLLDKGGDALNPEIIPQIELYTMYAASETMEAISSILNVDGFAYGKRLAGDVVTIKPTFDTEAESLQADGLLNGNENGLDLLKPLSRIEAAAMLLRAIGEPETAPEGSAQTFSDVPTTHWGYGTAERAASEGFIQGVGNGQFDPERTVAANEFATMVLRVAETGEFDWQQAMEILIEQGIITEENAETMDLFTRGDMAKIIYEARQKGLLN